MAEIFRFLTGNSIMFTRVLFWSMLAAVGGRQISCARLGALRGRGFSLRRPIDGSQLSFTL
jgi:hypothetical protein